MKFQTFIIGLLASFGLAFLCLIVLPFLGTKSMAAPAYEEELDGRVGHYEVKRKGQVTTGAQVFAGNGCYVCHTQMIRPTYAGTDVWNVAWAGKSADTGRETTAFDFSDESYAQVGMTRTGPDLSNVAYRIEKKALEAGVSAEAWLYRHLYKPSGKPETSWSNCPSSKHLFKLQKVQGQGSAQAVDVEIDVSCDCLKGKDLEVVPKGEAQALVSYLLSMKKDEALPFAVNPNPKKKPAN